jgi:hypothetical protein
VSASGGDHSSRGVLLSVMCPLSVIVKSRKWRPIDRSATGKKEMVLRMDNIESINTR